MDPRTRIIRRLEHDVAQLVMHKSKRLNKKIITKMKPPNGPINDQRRQKKQTNGCKGPRGNLLKSEQETRSKYSILNVIQVKVSIYRNVSMLDNINHAQLIPYNLDLFIIVCEFSRTIS